MLSIPQCRPCWQLLFPVPSSASSAAWSFPAHMPVRGPEEVYWRVACAQIFKQVPFGNTNKRPLYRRWLFRVTQNSAAAYSWCSRLMPTGGTARSFPCPSPGCASLQAPNHRFSGLYYDSSNALVTLRGLNPALSNGVVLPCRYFSLKAELQNQVIKLMCICWLYLSSRNTCIGYDKPIRLSWDLIPSVEEIPGSPARSSLPVPQWTSHFPNQHSRLFLVPEKNRKREEP